MIIEDIIKKANIEVCKKIIIQKQAGKDYVFESYQDVLDFFKPYNDECLKETGGAFILPSFIELCYRALPDSANWTVNHKFEHFYNPPPLKQTIRYDRIKINPAS